MEAARAKGIFRESRKRGRGIWPDGDHIVVDLGSRLVVDGKELEIGKFKSPGGYIYEVGDCIDLDLSVAPLTAQESSVILKVAKKFAWPTPLNAYLCAGWVVVAPFSGILPWRAHLWITGPTTAGKSTLLDRFIEPLTPFRFDTALMGDSSAAGIRQALGSDALPISIDEAEPSEKAASERLEALLSLLRGASSSKGNKTLKGTPSGKALSYKFRCSAALASIEVPINNSADKNRLTQLELKKLKSELWLALLEELKTFTPKFGARFFRRILKLAPTLLKNIPVFHDVVTTKLNDSRAGQQYGALLAGAWTIEHDNVATLDEATKFVSGLDWSDGSHAGPVGSDSDEERYLTLILDAQVQLPITEKIGDFESQHTHSDRRVISELLTKALTGDGDIGVSEDDAVAVLDRHGIRVCKKGTGLDDGHEAEMYFWIANQNENLAKIIGRPNGSWKQHLGRIEGHVKSGSKSQKFNRRNRCYVALPASIILGDGNEVK